MLAALLAALTVTSMPGADCPAQREIEARLRSLGVDADEAIDLRFTRHGDVRSVTITRAGSPARTLVHEGADCSSLAEASVALLSVLLDEGPAPPRLPPPTDENAHSIRIEGGAVASSGLVAPLAAGAEIGVRVHAWRAASFMIAAEYWPERAHPAGAGSVTTSAGTLSAGACAGPSFARVSLDACLLAFAGAYSLSAERFPIVHPTTRLLWGGEISLRAAFAVTRDLGIFVRGSVWAPAHPIDATVRGAATPFSMAALGPKCAAGIELGF